VKSLYSRWRDMRWQVRASDTRGVREWINSLASQDVFSASQATLTLILFAKCEWSVSKKICLGNTRKKEAYHKARS
jgi:hypothetical protein